MQETVTLNWLGHLVRQRPELFGGHPGEMAVLEASRSSSHESCVYGAGNLRVHVKFFGRTLGRTNVTYDPCREMKAEYGILMEFEKNGFSSGRHQIVRALGFNEGLDYALATVYMPGDTLLSTIQRTLKGREGDEELLKALDLTAGLLRKIHAIMPQGQRVDGAETFYSYLKAVLYLEEQGALDGFHRRVTKGLSRWYNHRPLFEQKGVTVHGDANPSNFKIHEGIIYGFDVERSRPGQSPLLDVGTVVAELRHHSAYLAKDIRKAEPYVERFLRAYAPAPGDQKTMRDLLPFYVSRGLFKIAMLGYWKHDYQRYLVEQGTKCIEEGP